ncbi:MAG: YcaO-like family protein, partial [Planctomycetes bacterium]|nr:YcaO-like family protein [Planctomycetota bacterium]
IGEAIERIQAYPLPVDASVEASVSDWPLEEPAVGPGRWTLFHPDQYHSPGFHFAPFTRETRCRWVCFREAVSGAPHWIPEEIGYLFHPPGSGPRITPSYSTGLSCGRAGHPVLLRGLQEVIERDAVVGAWWGSYALEEWEEADVLPALDPSLPPKFLRPNRRYRFYRARSPFSDHVTLVTAEGEDRDGFLFAAGSACRETRAQSWTKSLLEAIQGLSYVRQLRADRGGLQWVDELSDYAHHAAYYAAHPERLKETAFRRAVAPASRTPASESLTSLRERLGPERPALFRIMTPPGIAEEQPDWRVLRVVVPGLQPLHGDHRRPHLGGVLWNRPVADWEGQPPHPFA